MSYYVEWYPKTRLTPDMIVTSSSTASDSLAKLNVLVLWGQ